MVLYYLVWCLCIIKCGVSVLLSVLSLFYCVFCVWIIAWHRWRHFSDWDKLPLISHSFLSGLWRTKCDIISSFHISRVMNWNGSLIKFLFDLLQQMYAFAALFNALIVLFQTHTVALLHVHCFICCPLYNERTFTAYRKTS